MQAPLAVVGCIFGLLAWWQIGDLAFMAGAVLMIANWPWTLHAHKQRPDGHGRGRSVTANPGAYRQMGKLHAVRSALGSLATIVFLSGCISA